MKKGGKEGKREGEGGSGRGKGGGQIEMNQIGSKIGAQRCMDYPGVPHQQHPFIVPCPGTSWAVGPCSSPWQQCRDQTCVCPRPVHALPQTCTCTGT